LSATDPLADVCDARLAPKEAHLGTSISGWGRSVLLALNGLGRDGPAIFRACGLDPEAQGKALVRNPVARMQHVWRMAEEQVADRDLLAIEIARHLNASSFYALGFGLYASVSIDDMLRRFSRFGAIMSASVDFVTTYDKREIIFQVVDRRAVQSRLTAVVFILFLLRICRELGGLAAMPLRVEVPWRKSEYESAIRHIADSKIGWDRGRLALIFDRAETERRLPSANTELANFQDRLCRDYLASLDEHAHLPARVRLKIAQGLANDRATISDVAASLHMSRRSLQRKLRQEGADFRSILSAVRSELAAEYAKNRELSATVIAYELGFSGPAQFAVAFRGWYGMSFTDYRNRLSPRSQR